MIILFGLFIVSQQINKHIISTRPITLASNAQSQKIFAIFYFKLANQIQIGDSIFIKFPNLASDVDPQSCKFFKQDNITNLNLAQCSNAATNTVQINLPSFTQKQKMVGIKSPINLFGNQQVLLQVQLNNPNPNLRKLSSLVQIYTATESGKIIDSNRNFQQIQFTDVTSSIFDVNEINQAATKNQPQRQISFQLELVYKIQIPTSKSRIRITVDSPWTFTTSTTATTQNDKQFNSILVNQYLYAAALIEKSTLISPNIFQILFNQKFVVNRQFILKITNIKNPLNSGEAKMSIYSLPFNSQTPTQAYKLIKLQVKPHQLTSSVSLGSQINIGQDIFYSDRKQHIKVTSSISKVIKAGGLIKYDFSNLVKLIPGTAFLDISGSDMLYSNPSDGILQISGIPQIPSSTPLNLYVQTILPAGPAPQYTITIAYSTQVNYQVTSTFPSPIITYNFTDSTTELSFNDQPDIIKADGKFQIRFTNPGDTNPGAYMEIYLPQWVDGSGAICKFTCQYSCSTAGQQTIDCQYSRTSGYSKFIYENLTQNYFSPNKLMTLTITGLSFDKMSNNQLNRFEAYYKLSVSSSSSAKKYSWFSSGIVVGNRDLSTNYDLYFGNKLYNQQQIYPNIIELKSLSIFDFNYSLLNNQQRVVSIYSRYGFKGLKTDIQNQDPYPCNGNPELQLKCWYVRGQDTTQLNHILNWDRVHILFTNSTHQQSNVFHLILPYKYTSSSQHNFQLLRGTYNTQTFIFNYKDILSKFTINPSNSEPSNLVPQTAMTISGKAGSKVDDLTVEVGSTTSFGYSAVNSQASIVIVTDWQFFSTQSTYGTSPFTQTQIYKPLFLKYISNNKSKYLIFLSLDGNPSSFNTTLLNFSFNKVRLPYTYDLPDYNIFLINQLGDIDSYNKFQNSNTDSFYSAALKALNADCEDKSEGVLNTFCDIYFQTHSQIRSTSKIYVQVIGLTIQTNLCKFQNGLTTVPISCQSSTNQSQLIVSFTSDENMPDDDTVQFKLRIFGVGIKEQLTKQFIVSIRDSSGNYVIQKGQRLLITTSNKNSQIRISQLSYQLNNPIVVTTLEVLMYLPRNMLQDQHLVMQFGNDLSDSNTKIQKIEVQLYHQISSGSFEIQVNVQLKNFQLIFQLDYKLIVQGNYNLKLFGIKSPSSHSNGIIRIFYQRVKDSLTSLSNSEATTASFPALQNKINSNIKIQQMLFNTEGLPQQVKFSIKMSNQQFDNDCLVYVSFPAEYSAGLLNNPIQDIYCRLDEIPIGCINHDKIPYMIELFGSPRVINPNIQFVVSIYNLVAPQYTSTPQNENIFIGIRKNSSSTSYIEYSSLQPNTSSQLINTFALIILKGFFISPLQAFSSAYHIIQAVSQKTISSGSIGYVVLPAPYNNLNELPLLCIFKINNVEKNRDNCSVQGRRIKFQVVHIINNGQTFSIQIESVPTPKQSITIDLNTVFIYISDSSNSQITHASNQLTNLLTSVTFNLPLTYLKFNNDQSILITKGTYTRDVQIQGSDNLPFKSNIKIVATADGFVFQPNIILVNLGNTQTKFDIGADKDLIEKIYVFDVIKTETSITPFYQILTNLNIAVTSNPKTIQIPNRFKIAKGGCSLPVKISLSNAPFTDLSINYQYNNTKYPQQKFFINLQVSGYNLQFLKNQTEKYISFCTSKQIGVSQIQMKFKLGGTNYESYTLNNEIAELVIVQTPKVSPQIIITQQNIFRTSVELNISGNVQGYYYYHLFIYNTSQQKNLTDIKVSVKAGELIIKKMEDLMIKVQGNDLDQRYGIQIIQKYISFISITTQPTLTLNKLRPSTKYKFCAHLLNAFRQASDMNCIQFTTSVWQNVQKAQLNFSKNISAQQLNNVLCFFVKYSQTTVYNIINSQGESCSLDGTPVKYSYGYSGKTFSHTQNRTNIYLIPDLNKPHDTAIDSFKALFDISSLNLNIASDSLASTQFSINYIASAFNSQNFDLLDTAKPIDQRTVNLFDQPQGKLFHQYRSPNLYINYSSNLPSSIYIAISKQKQIFIDQTTGQINITIKDIKLPDRYSIVNCKDWYDIEVKFCYRGIVSSQETIEMVIEGLQKDSLYTMYYSIGNQHPIRPVAKQLVGQVRILTMGKRLVLMVLLWVIYIVN